MNRKADPGDLSEGERAVIGRHLSLTIEEAPQRVHRRRGTFNDLYWLVWAGAHAALRVEPSASTRATLLHERGSRPCHRLTPSAR
jgi:hypothetical protein